MDVLVLIRHPGAFVGSILKQGWDHDFNDFLAQPLMMRDQLEPFEDEIRRYAGEPQSRLDQAILLWNLIHHQILRFREGRPAWDFRLHEDLSREPVAFDAELLNPLRFRIGISALHDMVISDLRFEKRDQSA